MVRELKLTGIRTPNYNRRANLVCFVHGFPIHNGRGELVAYAGRSIDDTEPKYKFPSGFHKIELCNLQRVLALAESRVRRVIVVEGFFDCMKIHQAGYPHVVALMGSSMSREQENILASHFKGIGLALDGDEVGSGRQTRLQSDSRGASSFGSLRFRTADNPTGSLTRGSKNFSVRCEAKAPLIRAGLLYAKFRTNRGRDYCNAQTLLLTIKHPIRRSVTRETTCLKNCRRANMRV